MRNLDYNKIMRDISYVLIILFCIVTINDYINYSYVANSAPFYTFVIFRAFQFILPSIILLYLYEQNTNIKSSEYDIKSEKFSCDLNYKIAHISDFHNTNSKRIKSNIKRLLELNKPDIIVITGDLVDARRTNFDTAKNFLKSLKHIAPIYYVLGNHESRIESIHKLVVSLKDIGINVLRNEVAKLSKQNTTVEIVGLDDPGLYDIPNDKSVSQAVSEQLDKLSNSNNNNNFKILLSHRPELLKVYSNYKFDLVFTGHAHGGQIRIPMVGGVIAPGQGILPKYTKGVYNEYNTQMIVSRGIGNSKFPFRVNNRPEIIFVRLRRK